MVAQLVLYEEEHRQITAICNSLCTGAKARAVFMIDKNGQLMASAGDVVEIDVTSLASLVAGEIAATGGLAQLMGEKEFSNLLHEGAKDHLYLSLVSSRAILVLIFDNRTSLGLVRLRVRKCTEEMAKVFDQIQKRSEESGQDTPLAEITDDDIDNLFSM